MKDISWGVFGLRIPSNMPKGNDPIKQKVRKLRKNQMKSAPPCGVASGSK